MDGLSLAHQQRLTIVDKQYRRKNTGQLVEAGPAVDETNGGSMQELIVASNGEMTMSSLELLNIINGARVTAGEATIRRNDFSARVTDELDGMNYETFVVANPNGTESTGIMLSYDQCILVSMRESKIVRRSILEAMKAMKPKAVEVPKTLSAALRLAADQAEQIERQQAVIEQQKPAVQFLETYVEARSTKSLREVAKVLGIKEREFTARLESEKIMFRQSGSLLPFAEYQHKGLFEVKTGEAHGHCFHQARFTPSGVAWIAKRFQ